MNLTAQLPARMTCLLCFTPEALERRTDRKGRPYYTCGLCHFRVFLSNDTQAFGVLFWSRALQGDLVRAARTDLERALATRGHARDIPAPIAASPAPTEQEAAP